MRLRGAHRGRQLGQVLWEIEKGTLDVDHWKPVIVAPNMVPLESHSFVNCAVNYNLQINYSTKYNSKLYCKGNIGIAVTRYCYLSSGVCFRTSDEDEIV